MKTKLGIRVDISNTLLVSLFPIPARWNRLIAEKQAQGSHTFSVMVTCIFHALFICFCVVSYFEGMCKRYHGDQKTFITEIRPVKLCGQCKGLR